MENQLRKDSFEIINYCLQQVKPDETVKKALKDKKFAKGKLILIAIGKASYQMAKAALELIEIDEGIVISKYQHFLSPLKSCRCYEAGHPISDENTFLATNEVLKLTNNLKENDTVIFLVSGGGSALFEDSYLSLNELQDINSQLLKCGASIQEINTIRKRLSKVKGGKFAKHCAPAHIYQIVLSDIINDPLDMIASGPAYPDSSTCLDALKIVEKYHLNLSKEALKYLNIETIKEIDNVKTTITGSVKQLCLAAYQKALQLGYKPIILKTDEQGFAKDASKSFCELLLKQEPKTCLIMGGETLVEVKGNGLGGRNQEFALTSYPYINKDIAVLSLGSDGTDGPTDAAGGYLDYEVKKKIDELNLNVETYLENNDSYNCLKQVDGLIITGPTGSNVNDVMIGFKK